MIVFLIIWCVVGTVVMQPHIAKNFRAYDITSVWESILAVLISVTLIIFWPVWSFPIRKER